MSVPPASSRRRTIDAPHPAQAKGVVWLPERGEPERVCFLCPVRVGTGGGGGDCLSPCPKAGRVLLGKKSRSFRPRLAGG